MDGKSTVNEIAELHTETVRRWHQEPINNPYADLLEAVCQQHQFNYLLWHEEDIARSPNVGDERIAEVKRAIDKYNQQRNDWIEKIDEYLLHEVNESGTTVPADAPLNTETPASAIDRLSIMSLRIYHMHEQLEREDANEQHLQNVQTKLHRCYEQHADLSRALAMLLDDIFSGQKQLKLYRQMKMYNDPKLNPYLYAQGPR